MRLRKRLAAERRRDESGGRAKSVRLNDPLTCHSERAVASEESLLLMIRDAREDAGSEQLRKTMSSSKGILHSRRFK